jgi:hypothetical protein
MKEQEDLDLKMSKSKDHYKQAKSLREGREGEGSSERGREVPEEG